MKKYRIRNFSIAHWVILISKALVFPLTILSIWTFMFLLVQ